jgi:hypothetical protein
VQILKILVNQKRLSPLQNYGTFSAGEEPKTFFVSSMDGNNTNQQFKQLLKIKS